MRLVLFDLDDTLMRHRSAVEEGLADYLAALGAPFDTAATDPGRLALFQALEEEHYPRYLAGEYTLDEQRSVRARAFMANYGATLTPAEGNAWFDGYREQYRRHWRLFDDALGCFDELVRRQPSLRFGIITNGDGPFQRMKVEALGLSDRVEHVVCSGDLGIAKPDARIFTQACALFDIPPSEAAYVGDRFRTDALGAAGAGLTGVWIDRYAEPLSDDDWERGAAASIRMLTTLADLPDALLGRPDGEPVGIPTDPPG